MFRAVFLSVGKFLCAVKSLNYFASQIKFRLIVTIFGTSKEKAALSNHPLLFLQPRLQFQCLEIVSLFMDHPCARDLLFGPSVCRITWSSFCERSSQKRCSPSGWEEIFAQKVARKIFGQIWGNSSKKPFAPLKIYLLLHALWWGWFQPIAVIITAQ